MRIRRLQRRDETGRWYSDAYAVEGSEGRLTFRYSLAWEHVGARYHRRIRESGVGLERLEEVLSDPGIRWLPVETIDSRDTGALRALDRECQIPCVGGEDQAVFINVGVARARQWAVSASGA